MGPFLFSCLKQIIQIMLTLSNFIGSPLALLFFVKLGTGCVVFGGFVVAGGNASLTKYFFLISQVISFVCLFLGVLCWLELPFVYASNQEFFGLFSLDWALTYEVYFGYDSVSLFFVLLTIFLTPFCLSSAYHSLSHNFFLFLILFLVMEFSVISAFIVLDLFFFYLAFESLLIPMFIIIGWWGASQRRALAAFYFFLFTLAGSLLLLVGLLIIRFDHCHWSYFQLLSTPMSLGDQKLLWLFFFIPFAIKIPMFPFHIWLPEAHVEAPTAASMFLAGVLLKLGAYGFLRFLLPLFFDCVLYYQPFLMAMSLIGVFYSSLVALRQVDIKRIVAYSSIAHMNFALLGLFSLTASGFCGSYLIFIGHGVVSAALFYFVGVLSDRYKTRVIWYYSGMTLRMPLANTFFFLLALGNVAFPLTVNFVGELLVLFGLGSYNLIIPCIAGVSLVLTLSYTFWTYNRVSFGAIRVNINALYLDLRRDELVILFFLTAVMFLLGCFPSVVLQDLGSHYTSFVGGGS